MNEPVLEATWNDELRWCGVYDVGSTFDEEIAGECVGFGTVDAGRVEVLSLRVAGSTDILHTVLIPEGCHPYFGRDRHFVTSIETGEVVGQATITVIGFEQAPEQGVYLFVLPDGSSVVSTDRHAIQVT